VLLDLKMDSQEAVNKVIEALTLRFRDDAWHGVPDAQLYFERYFPNGLIADAQFIVLDVKADPGWEDTLRRELEAIVVLGDFECARHES